MKQIYFSCSLILFLVFAASGQHVCDHALQFDGNNSYVNCGPGSNFNVKDQLTVEAWVKLDSSFYSQFIAGNFDDSIYAGFQLGVKNGSLYCAIRDTSVGTRSITIYGVRYNVWTHLAFTYKVGGRFSGYVNGKSLFNIPASNARIGDNGTSPFVIGSCPWKPDTFETHGWIDEVRVYNLERSISQIRKDMRTLLNGPEIGLVGYWKFSEGSGSFTNDFSGNQHHGTLVGTLGPVWQTAEGPYGEGVNAIIFGVPSGNLSIAGTSLEFNFPFSCPDTFVVTRIDCSPNSLPVTGPSYSYSYWVVDRYGLINALPTDHIFSFLPGSISVADSINPANLQLYNRDGFSIGPWTNFQTASSASFIAASITFSSVTTSGQYIVSTTGNSVLGSNSIANSSDIIDVFPNPADDYCTIQLKNEVNFNSISLYDFKGELIFFKNDFPLNGKMIFNVSQLSSGLYFFKLNASGIFQFKKIFITHH